jgi:hypothetical protein
VFYRLTRPSLQDAVHAVLHHVFSARHDCVHDISHALGDTCASSPDYSPAILFEHSSDFPGNPDLWIFSGAASNAFVLVDRPFAYNIHDSWRGDSDPKIVGNFYSVFPGPCSPSMGRS